MAWALYFQAVQSQKLTVLFVLVFLLGLPAWRVMADNSDGSTLIWSLRLPFHGTQSSAALAPDGTIYQGTSTGWLLAISPQGKIKWRFRAGREIFSSPAIGAEGTIYFGSRDGKFYALDPRGQLQWTFATGAWVDSSPAIGPDGTVYFGSWDGNFYALSAAGALKWKFVTGQVIFSSPAMATDGTIYFGSHDKNFYALDPTGKMKWKFATGAEIESSPAINAAGTVYFTSTDGNFYAVSPVGKELWRLHTGDHRSNSPVLDPRGYIFIGVGCGYLNSFNASIDDQGKFRWKRGTDFEPDQACAVAANGQVYVNPTWLQIGALGTDQTAWPAWQPWTFHMTANLASSPTVAPDGTIYACDGDYLFAFKPAVNAAPLDNSPWPMWRANPQHTGRVAVVN